MDMYFYLIIGLFTTVIIGFGVLSIVISNANKRITNDITSSMQDVQEQLEYLEKTLRSEIVNSSRISNEGTIRAIEGMGSVTRDFAALSEQRLGSLSGTIERQIVHINTSLEGVRGIIDIQLREIRKNNEEKLEQMRQTVDEKLHTTLNKRLGESFELVNKQLEQVHKGLGEMQSLATGVGDLKKVLTNVKTRGTWGEVALSTLLAQVLIPSQYAANVACVPTTGDRVEYAIILPGKNDGGNVYLPIDSKFPQEDYARLVDASQAEDIAAIESSGRALEQAVKLQAKKIFEKYVSPPATTDFAIMFLPVEGLYAEVLRRPGLVERLQVDYRVVVTGPTTLAALLNSLQMGFKTLAIEKRSSEVWSLLAAVKGEFSKFGDLLEKTQQRLRQASESIEDATKKTRTIERKLARAEMAAPDNIVELGTMNLFEDKD